MPVRVGPAEAAILETFVVPRYLSLFGELMLEMLAEGDEAQVVHLDCLTGYPDRGVCLKMPGAHVYGVDPSPHAIALAKAKAATMPEMVSDYRAAEGWPVPLPSGAFSHGFAIQAPAVPAERVRLHAELARLVAPSGQALVAMPLRGSFQEILDLLREFALRHEANDLATAVELAARMRPSPDDLAGEIGAAGFEFVEVATRTTVVPFQSGRDFFEDPMCRLLVLPELAAQLGTAAMARPMAYVRDAIDKYWSDAAFELTLNVGCASGRRLAG